MKLYAKLLAVAALFTPSAVFAAVPDAFANACCAMAECCGMGCC